MATSTPNYGLYKYGGDDSPDLTKLGPTMDKIDLELKKNADNIGLLAGALANLGNVTDQNSNSLPSGYGYVNGANAASNNYPANYGIVLCIHPGTYISQTFWTVAYGTGFFTRTSLDAGATWTAWTAR